MRSLLLTPLIVFTFPSCQGKVDDHPCHRAASPAGVAFCEEKFGTLNKWVCTDQTCPLIRIQKRGCVTLDLMERAGYQPDDLCVFDPGDWNSENDMSSTGSTSGSESEGSSTTSMSETSGSEPDSSSTTTNNDSGPNTGTETTASEETSGTSSDSGSSSDSSETTDTSSNSGSS